MKGIIAAAGMSSFLFFSVAADATEFKCGKRFITFTHQEGTYDGKRYPAAPITVSKKDIVVVAAKSSGIQYVAMKFVGGGGLIRYIDEDTRHRIIDCLG